MKFLSNIKLTEKLYDLLEMRYNVPHVFHTISHVDYTKSDECRFNNDEYKFINKTLKLDLSNKITKKNCALFKAITDNGDMWKSGDLLVVKFDYDRLRRGDYTVLVNNNDEISVSKVTAPGWPSFPDLFDKNETVGITHWIVGKVVKIINLNEHLNKNVKLLTF